VLGLFFFEATAKLGPTGVKIIPYPLIGPSGELAVAPIDYEQWRGLFPKSTVLAVEE
jgi:hypothetical protein